MNATATRGFLAGYMEKIANPLSVVASAEAARMGSTTTKDKLKELRRSIDPEYQLMTTGFPAAPLPGKTVPKKGTAEKPENRPGARIDPETESPLSMKQLMTSGTNIPPVPERPVAAERAGTSGNLDIIPNILKGWWKSINPEGEADVRLKKDVNAYDKANAPAAAPAPAPAAAPIQIPGLTPAKKDATAGKPSGNWETIRGMLGSWVAPAAAGAAAVGGASVGMDVMNRKKREAGGKPGVNVKKALLLSVTLGVPLGLATKMLATEGGRSQIAGMLGKGKTQSA